MPRAFSYQVFDEDGEAYDVTSSFPEDLYTFSSHSKIDFFNHVVSIEEALKVLAYGMKTQHFHDSSRIANTLKDKKFTKILPSTSSPLFSSSIGNVSFSAEVTIHDSENRFYFLECFDGFGETITRVVLTNKTYNDLTPVDLTNKNSVIYLNERKELMFASEWELKEITLEIFLEISPFSFTNISYVRGDSARPVISGKILSGRHSVFTDETLGYLMFTLVKERAGNNHTVLKDEDLIDQLMKLSVFNYVVDKPRIPSVLLNPSLTARANRIMQELTIPRSFGFGTSTDREDSETIRKLSKHFEKTRHLPSPKACLRKIHDILAIKDPDHYSRSNNANVALHVFLNHFETCRKNLASSIFRFIHDTWNLS